jgi:hypothetical protein
MAGRSWDKLHALNIVGCWRAAALRSPQLASDHHTNAQGPSQIVDGRRRHSFSDLLIFFLKK